MRVVLVAPYDLAEPGGVQSQVIGLAAALRGLGDDLLLIAPGATETWAIGTSLRDHRLERPAGALPVLVGTGRSVRLPANGSRAPVTVSPFALRRTRQALASFAPDVIHVHEPLVPGPSLTAACSGIAPVVATFHRAGATGPYRLFGPLVAPVVPRLDRAFAVSEAARATLASVVGATGLELELRSNGVDLERLARPGLQTGTLLRAVEQAGGTVGHTVVFVGRHERRKGLDVLLEAFEAARVDATLVVVGDGPERRRIEARHGHGRVAFVGRLDDDEVAAQIAASDLLVAPSRGGESFGVILLEAMAAGTAVLASDLPGYRLAAGDAAHFVPPGEATALASAIEDLLGDDAERARLVERGRARVAEHDFSVLAASYRETYLELCGSRLPG